MYNQDLPRLRVLVDWDGDGFINRGVKSTDPLNLANRPLTLNDIAVKPGAYNFSAGANRRAYRLPAFYDPTDRGLFASEFPFTGVGDFNFLGSGVSSGPETTYLVANGMAAGTYTLQFYVKGVSGFSGKTFSIKIQDNGGSNPTPADYTLYLSNNTTTFTPTGNYVLVSHTFTRTASGSAFSAGPVLRITQATGASTPAILRITGVSLHTGTLTTAQPYNVGTPISLRDDIEPYIMSAQWQLGMATPDDNVAAEGTATVQLRNLNYEFSIESPNSFLYESAGNYPYRAPVTKFREGVLMIIEVQNATTLAWSEMWRGFISSIKVGTGTTQPTATLNATQGLFKFGSNKPNLEPLQNKRADEIIKALINSGWITPIIPNQAAIGKTQLRDAFTYDTITDASTYQLDTGLETYDISGEAWRSGESSPLDVIQELMIVEQGLFFVTRSGKLRFLHRDRLYNTAASEPADVVLTDAITNNTDYINRQSLINSVKVEYYPKVTTSAQLWQTKELITVKPGPVQKMTVKLENYENSKITATAINSFTASVLPSIKVVTDPAGTPLNAGGVSVVMALRNGEIELSIQSYYAGEVKLQLVINGTIILSYGGMSTYRSYLPSQVGVGTNQKVVTSKLLTSATRAGQLADFVLQQQSRRFATFSSFSISSRDATWLQRILDITLGTRVRLSETNTGGVSHRVIVVGESASWTPGILSMNYVIRPSDNVPYLTMDTTPVNSEGVVY